MITCWNVWIFKWSVSGGDSIDGGPLEICNSEGVFSVYFWPGLVIVGMSLSQSLSRWLVTRQTKERFSRPRVLVTQAPGEGHYITFVIYTDKPKVPRYFTLFLLSALSGLLKYINIVHFCIYQNTLSWWYLRTSLIWSLNSVLNRNLTILTLPEK